MEKGDLTVDLFSKSTKKNPFGGSISRLSISQPCSLIEREFSGDVTTASKDDDTNGIINVVSSNKNDSIVNCLNSYNNKSSSMAEEESVKSLSSVVEHFVDGDANDGDEKDSNVTSVEVSWAAKDNIPAREDDEMTRDECYQTVLVVTEIGFAAICRHR